MEDSLYELLLTNDKTKNSRILFKSSQFKLKIFVFTYTKNENLSLNFLTLNFMWSIEF